MIAPTSPLVVLDRKDAWTCVYGDTGPAAGARIRVRAALDAPPTHAVIPMDDARAIAKWRANFGFLNGGDQYYAGASDAIGRLVASLPPEHPPWEPSEEQIVAYCRERGFPSGASDSAMRDLIAARAVFDREGIEG